jgi:hypothetical protein
MFYRARDLIDHPAERARITDEMVGFIRTQFFGALALQGQAERNAHLPGKPAR